MNNLLDTVSKIAANRLTQVFVAAHLLALALIYSFMPRQQGFSYHFTEEPSYYQLLFILDLPSILITGIIFYPIYSQGINAEWIIGLYIVVLLIITSTQWALIGYTIWKILKSWTDYRMR